jgi:hypothetical protein
VSRSPLPSISASVSPSYIQQRLQSRSWNPPDIQLYVLFFYAQIPPRWAALRLQQTTHMNPDTKIT